MWRCVLTDDPRTAVVDGEPRSGRELLNAGHDIAGLNARRLLDMT
jgi:hypothetical protein